MKKTQIIAITIAVIAVLWVGSGVLFSPDAPEDHHTIAQDNKEEETLAEVRVRQSKAEDFSYDIVVTGRSEAEAKVQIRAEISGPIITLHAEKGDTVEKGAPLAEIEVQNRAARLEEARQLLNQRQTEYNAAKTLNTKGFSTDLNLAEKRAQMEAARSALVEAETTLSKTKITAPIDGLINARPLDAGDFVNVGDALFTLVDLDPIKINGYIAERDLGLIEKGANARAEFLDGSVIEGPLSFIASAANPETRTFQVEMQAPNPEFKVQDGLTARMLIPVAARQAHKISPSILSLNEEGKIGVKIVNDDDIVVFKPIKILSDQSEFMWIDGLEPQVKIITVGQEFVKDGQQVKPVPSNGNGAL